MNIWFTIRKFDAQKSIDAETWDRTAKIATFVGTATDTSHSHLNQDSRPEHHPTEPRSPTQQDHRRDTIPKHVIRK